MFLAHFPGGQKKKRASKEKASFRLQYSCPGLWLCIGLVREVASREQTVLWTLVFNFYGERTKKLTEVG